MPRRTTALANILLPGTGATPQMFSGITENSIDGIADCSLARHSNPTSAIPGRFGAMLPLTMVSVGPSTVSLTAGTSGGNTNPAYRWWRQFPQPVGELQSMAAWSAAEAKANPSDACNGTLIVPGTTPCARMRSSFLAGLGVNLPLSNGTPGPELPPSWSRTITVSRLVLA